MNKQRYYDGLNPDPPVGHYGRRVAAFLLGLAAFGCGPISLKPSTTTRAIWIYSVPGATVELERAGESHVGTADAMGLVKFERLPNFAGQAINIHITAAGFERLDKVSATVPDGNVELRFADLVKLPPASAWTPTLAQKLDLQGDLMLRVPELALRCDGSGVDPRVGIRCVGLDGTVPRGLIDGYIWGLNVVRYRDPADRERIYQAALRDGHTHFQIAIGSCGIGEGYHTLMPETAETCATAADRVNTVLRELRAHKLIAMGVGATPDDPILDGLDRSLIRALGDDWDNSMQKDCRIDYLARNFPGVPIFVWRLANAFAFESDRCSQPPFTYNPDLVTKTGDAGQLTTAQWIRAVQRRVPAFVGIFHEVNIPEVGVDGAAAELIQALAAGMRDALNVLGESDTYWKFMQARGNDQSRSENDQVLARVPLMGGRCFSGCTTHPAPAAVEATTGAGAGELPIGDVTQMAMPPGFEGWAVGARITKLELRPWDLHIEFTRQYGDNRWPDVVPPGWEGGIQYTIGVAVQRNGQWFATTAIECWYGMDECGGPIQKQNVDNSGLGQISKNWLYGGWVGAMQGYQPAVGEVFGIFLCEGDCRSPFHTNAASQPLRERSQIVLIPMPAPDTTTTFTFP